MNGQESPLVGEQAPTRSDLIEALSWAEDMERGRWGVEYATAALEQHEARVLTDVADDLDAAGFGYAALRIRERVTPPANPGADQ